MFQFEHGRDQESFDQPADFRRVFEHVPGVGAVTLPLEADFPHCSEERRPVLRIDPVVHGDQHRPLIVIRRLQEVRRVPVQGRRQVERRRSLQLPPPRDDHAEKGPGGGDVEGRRQSLDAGDLAPDGAAESHRAEEGGQKNGESASAHPLREGHLRRNEQRRHHDDPARSRHKARRHRQHGLLRRSIHHERGDRAGARHERETIGTEPLLQPVEPEGADQRPQPDHAEEHAVDRRSIVHLRARDQRKKRPIGAREQEEGERADDRRVHVAVVPDVAKARPHGAGEALGRQSLLDPARSAPPQNRRRQHETAEAIAPDGKVDAEGRNGESAESRADRPADVVAGVVDGDRAVEVVLGRQHRRDEQPSRAQRARRPLRERRLSPGG